MTSWLHINTEDEAIADLLAAETEVSKLRGLLHALEIVINDPTRSKCAEELPLVTPAETIIELGVDASIKLERACLALTAEANIVEEEAA